MPDFTARGGYLRTPPALCNFGDTPAGDFADCTNSVPGSNIYTTANTAIYFPFTINWPYLAQKMGVQVATQSGNMDVGIYDEKGTRLVSMGSTAVAAAGLQVFNITDTWLMPGTYYMAINCDNTTAAFRSISSSAFTDNAGRLCGVQRQAVGAVALPNPATFAAFTARSAPQMIVTGATL